MVVRTVSYLRWYCSYVLNFLRFGRANEEWFLVFGVPNAKYLAFGTLDESALRTTNAKKLYSYFIYTFSLSSQHTSLSPRLVLSSPISPPLSQPRRSHHIDCHVTQPCRPPCHAADLAPCERFHSFIFRWWFFFMLLWVLLLWWLFFFCCCRWVFILWLWVDFLDLD